MKCPTCNGSKVMQIGMAWQGFKLPCESCDATGEISDNYPTWKPIGAQLKAARIARRETLRNFCKRVGEEYHIRSKMERGLIKPEDKYGELLSEDETMFAAEDTIKHIPFVEDNRDKVKGTV